MPLKPEDIPRPRVARAQAARARPTTVQLPRIKQPQAGAVSDVANATRRKAAAVYRLAARTRAAGREQAAAISERARAQSQAGLEIAFAQRTFSKTLGGIAKSFQLMEDRRRHGAKIGRLG